MYVNMTVSVSTGRSTGTLAHERASRSLKGHRAVARPIPFDEQRFDAAFPLMGSGKTPKGWSMRSPGLLVLRQRPDWPGAVAYFRTRIQTVGRRNVGVAVSAFRQKYAGNPTAALVDAVLSVRTPYDSVVSPAVSRWMMANPGATFASLVLAGGAPVGTRKASWAGYRTIAGVARVLSTYGHGAAETDDDRLAAWAQDAESFRFDHTRDSVGRVSGVGIAVFQYLRMRGGAEAIKPDQRVIDHFKRSGLSLPAARSPQYERVILFLAEAMAESLVSGSTSCSGELVGGRHLAAAT